MKKHTPWLAVASIMLYTLGSIWAQDVVPVGGLTPGVQMHATAPAAGASLQFTVFAPSTYDSNGTKRWPLIIQLPPGGATIEGSGSYGFHQLVTCGIPKLLATPATCKYVSDRFVVVSPFLHEAVNTVNLAQLHTWIKWLYKTYKIDSTCVSFYGTCWGGNAGYSYFTIHPEIPSAAYLFAINDGWSTGGRLDLTKACQLKNIAIKILRGINDTPTPLSGTLAAANAIHACGGGNDTFIQIPGPHEIYNSINADTAMYTWFLSHKISPTSVVPRIDNNQNANHTMDFDTRMTETDKMEIMDISGKVVFRCKRNGLQANRMIPQLGRGLYLTRIISPDHRDARIMIVR